MNLRDAVPILQKAAYGNLDSLNFLWMDRDGEARDLQGRHAGDHLAIIGHTASILEPTIPALAELFGFFARVSRQPYTTFLVTASSATDFVIRYGIDIARAVDAAFRDRTIRKPDGLSEEEREVLRKCWKTLQEPFRNSNMLPTIARCRELRAEVNWECQRVIALLPPEEKKVMAAPGTIEVFFSYSHKDERLRIKLVNHLSQLKHEGLIRDWHDRKIGAGTQWHGQINEHLSSAHIILLLVSSDFLASEYIHDVEIKRALERHEAGEARVIPVILRSCDWHSAPFGKLQALPTDAKPITKWSDRDEAFTMVAKGIRAVVKEIVDATKSGT